MFIEVHIKPTKDLVVHESTQFGSRFSPGGLFHDGEEVGSIAAGDTSNQRVG
ncbi:hypothetical protein [Thermococcus sp. 18S1]|uniref:hypothetical protein n=1 Tax=Thermococcus sp. 18S1 TaxID=1638210 RepID=UPI00143A81A4|nr:hypothetical protein [Thermococcus sp. 18S1]